MSKGTKITLTIVTLILLIGAVSIMTIWSHRNTAVALEERINAQYTANKSNYDNMWKSFKEMTQITELQANQFKDVYKGLIEGRYDDPNVLFKMVQEQNPQLDTSVYAQLQRQIAAGRTTFDNNQKTLADIVREYNTYVRKHIVMAAITGKQPKNMDDFIVTSQRTQDAFDTKKDDEIDLSGSKSK